MPVVWHTERRQRSLSAKTTDGFSDQAGFGSRPWVISVFALLLYFFFHYFSPFLVHSCVSFYLSFLSSYVFAHIFQVHCDDGVCDAVSHPGAHIWTHSPSGVVLNIKTMCTRVHVRVCTPTCPGPWAKASPYS